MNQNSSFRKFSAILVCFLFTGCASFQPAMRFQDMVRTREPTVKDLKEGLEVSVEEFFTSAKSKEAFDADMGSNDVLALLIRAENKGSRTYHLHQNQVKATLQGNALTSLSGVEAANMAGTSEYIGKALAWTVATGPLFFLLWPATMGGSTYHTQQTNKRIQAHFEGLRFSGGALKPNQSLAGFLYYKLPSDANRLENLNVQLDGSEEETGKHLVFDFSFPTLNLSAGNTPAEKEKEDKR